jgi:lysophospholipase L1-like esterase
MHRREQGVLRMEPGQWVNEAGTPIFINDLGFRARKTGPVPRKPPGRIRVAVLGDSETLCMALAYDECFPGRLERALLRRYPDSSFDVVSFGVVGTNTLQHEQWLNDLVLPLKPDLVILEYVMNDIEIFDEGVNVVDLGHWYDRIFVVRYTRFRLFAKRSASLRHKKEEVHEAFGATTDQVLWADYLTGLYAQPELWSVMRSTLRRMNRICDEAGVEFAIVGLPPLAGADDFHLDKYRYRDARLLLHDLEDDGILFMEPLPAFAKTGKPASVFAVSPTDYHHNARSNALLVNFVLGHPGFREKLDRVRNRYPRQQPDSR